MVSVSYTHLDVYKRQVEEVLGTGRMVHTSTDLEMIDDSLENGFQSVGLRFTAVEIPQGALIRSAYLEFVVDEVDTVATSLQIRSHALDNSQPFTPVSYTHLDVYKRQALHALCGQWLCRLHKSLAGDRGRKPAFDVELATTARIGSGRG